MTKDSPRGTVWGDSFSLFHRIHFMNTHLIQINEIVSLIHKKLNQPVIATDNLSGSQYIFHLALRMFFEQLYAAILNSRLKNVCSFFSACWI